MKKSIWDKILKVVIAVASAILGALGANAMNVRAMTEYTWMGDQDATSWDDLSVNNEADARQAIGAYKAGTNPRLDYAISKIDGINQFLTQGVNEAFSYEEDLEAMRGLL